MINTIHGPMDESALEKRVIETETEDANVTAIEYWQLVHRSVVADLKAKVSVEPQAQEI